jgi:hypothetical protein
VSKTPGEPVSEILPAPIKGGISESTVSLRIGGSSTAPHARSPKHERESDSDELKRPRHREAPALRTKTVDSKGSDRALRPRSSVLHPPPPNSGSGGARAGSAKAEDRPDEALQNKTPASPPLFFLKDENAGSSDESDGRPRSSGSPGSGSALGPLSTHGVELTSLRPTSMKPQSLFRTSQIKTKGSITPKQKRVELHLHGDLNSMVVGW